MNNVDTVDIGIYAGNPIGMRVSALKEMRDGGQCVPCWVYVFKKREREVCFIYVSTSKPMPMRVSRVDGASIYISLNT